MYAADVPALSDNDAALLARRLLEGENIITSNVYETAAAISQAVDRIPFYIHHLVLKLKMRRSIIDAAKISEIIDDCFIDPLNPWRMDRYRDTIEDGCQGHRIDNYYKDEHRNYALNMLDILPVTDQPLLFDDLFNRIKIEQGTQEKEIARAVLRLLERDYYVIRKSDRTYSFRYSLIQRYWNLLRG